MATKVRNGSFTFDCVAKITNSFHILLSFLQKNQKNLFLLPTYFCLI